MVAINIKYTAEELKPKSQIFFCGAGLIKCVVTGSEIGDSRYATPEKTKPQTLKVHYAVADGEYKGNENTIEFDLFDDSWVDFGGGKGETASKMAAQNFNAFSIACGFESYVQDSSHLHGKQLLINHEVKKGEVIEDLNEYGQKVPQLDENGQPQHYPDRSEVVRKGKKFARVVAGVNHAASSATTPQVAAPQPVAAPMAAPVQYVAPQAPQPQQMVAPVVYQQPVAPQPIASQPVQYAPPPAVAAPAINDDIPF